MIDFKLNFLGLTVADFDRSHHFYTQTLGIEEYKSHPGLAKLIGWMDVFVGGCGMAFELFGGGVPEPADRAWGRGQGIRPSFQVEDLEQTVAELRRRGVTLTGEIQETSWGQQIEFIAPEGIRWTLAHAPAYPFASSLRKPRLGWVELKAHNPAGQKTFYTDVMGLQLAKENESGVILQQQPGEPLLFIEPGGQGYTLPSDKPQAADENHPIFISFMTFDIKRAALHLRAHDVQIIQDVTVKDWGGTDMLIGDVDGNVVQVIQYALRGSFKEALDALAY